MLQKILKKLYFLLLIINIINAKSQSKLGDWNYYMSYKYSSSMCYNDDKIYVAFPNNILIYNIKDNTILDKTKLNGLSDIGISHINSIQEKNMIIIGYSNGNIDIIRNNQIINQPKIKQFDIIGDKSIYNSCFYDNKLYLSTGLGVVVVDYNTLNILDLYKVGKGGAQIKVNEIAVLNDTIYVATDEGLIYQNINNQFLTNYSSWKVLQKTDNKKCKQIKNIKNKLYLISKFTSDSLLYFDNINNISSIHLFDTISILGWSDSDIFFNKEKENQKDTIMITDFDFNIKVKLFEVNSYTFLNPNKIIEIDNKLYISTYNNSFFSYNKSNNQYNKIKPNSSDSEYFEDLDSKNGKIYGASGRVYGTGWNSTYNRDGVSVYDVQNRNWNVYSSNTYYDDFCIKIPGCLNDIMGVMPFDENKFYMFDWTSGIGMVEIENNKFTNYYDETNSTLKNLLDNPNNDIIHTSKARLDKNNTMWILNPQTSYPIHSMTKDKKWNAYQIEQIPINSILSDILIDENDNKWILHKDNSIFVFNENETKENEDDDFEANVNNSLYTGNLHSKPLCMAMDYNNELWIGTYEGITVLNNAPSAIKNNSFQSNRIKIEVEGNIEYLLSQSVITAIKVDGANRKWIGTINSGVFLFNEDGQEQIINFTTNNSPILSNNIIDIEIDEESGIVFFSTDNGLCSFHNDAIIPFNEMQELISYPNPVLPQYDGDIVIRGLVENSNIKILDVAGNMIFSTKALGGQAIWNGRKNNNERVKTGIYFIVANNNDNSQKQNGKILVIGKD